MFPQSDGAPGKGSVVFSQPDRTAGSESRVFSQPGRIPGCESVVFPQPGGVSGDESVNFHSRAELWERKYCIFTARFSGAGKSNLPNRCTIVSTIVVDIVSRRLTETLPISLSTVSRALARAVASQLPFIFQHAVYPKGRRIQ